MKCYTIGTSSYTPTVPVPLIVMQRIVALSKTAGENTKATIGDLAQHYLDEYMRELEKDIVNW